MSGERSKEAQIAELLRALRRSVGQIQELAQQTERGIRKRSFLPYHAYREAIDGYRALAMTVEHRLAHLPDKTRARVEQQLLASERSMLGLTIGSALNFFFALSAIPALPLGTREVFERELQALKAARARLTSPEHAGQLSADLAGDLETAEEILIEVMKKAPRFMEFPLDRAKSA